MSHQPTLIFVPGAWHSSDTWAQVIAQLTPQGYKCIAVSLPSTMDINAGFGDDVQAVQTAIQAETTNDKDVVLIVHSYGGQVGNSAIRGFAKQSHNGSPARGDKNSGHVIGLAMMATGFTITGVGFLEGAGGKPPPQWVADTDTGLATIVVDARDMLYHDLPEEEGALWVSKLTQQSLKALAEGGEHAYAGWKDVPCWFLVTLEDHALPAHVQELFVQGAIDAGATVTLQKIAASHSPMLSKVEETAAFITSATDDFTRAG